MAIDVYAKAALLSALSVQTYLEKQEDAVTLNVRFGALADGTSYTAQPIISRLGGGGLLALGIACWLCAERLRPERAWGSPVRSSPSTWSRAES